MPGNFDLDAATRIIHSHGWGAVTGDDLLNQVKRMRELFQDGAIDSTWVQIIDTRAVENFAGVSSDGIQHVAVLNPWPQTSHRAIIASTDLGYALGRMYQLRGGDQNENVRVVRSKAEAGTWVTQEQDGFEPES